MSEPFIAEIRIFPFTFAPRGWAFCNGQVLPIAQNTALFSLIGTTYGGDGRTTLGLPNLMARAPMHPGRGPGLTQRRLGETGGTSTVTLTEAQVPAHSHALKANLIDLGDTSVPGTGVTFAQSAGGGLYQASSDTQLAAGALASKGAGQAHNNLQPYLTVNFCIALTGLYPSRS